MLTKETASVQTIVALSIFPLAFGTDMVAPVKALPGWLQAWANINPVGHTMTACRGLLIGGQVMAPAVTSLLWSAGLIVVFAPLAVLGLPSPHLMIAASGSARRGTGLRSTAANQPARRRAGALRTRARRGVDLKRPENRWRAERSHRPFRICPYLFRTDGGVSPSITR